jgi:hypothetical protein
VSDSSHTVPKCRRQQVRGSQRQLHNWMEWSRYDPLKGAIRKLLWEGSRRKRTRRWQNNDKIDPKEWIWDQEVDLYGSGSGCCEHGNEPPSAIKEHEYHSRYSDWPRGRSLGPGKGKIFLLSTGSRPISGAHPASYPRGTGWGEVKGPGCQANHSPSTSAKVKNTWIYTSILPYTLMA